MLLCPCNSKVSLAFWFSVPIISWCNFHDYMFVEYVPVFNFIATLLYFFREFYACMPWGWYCLLHYISFLAHDRMSVASLCNPDLSVVVVVIIVIVIVVVIVVCEHSSWPHAWSNKVHTLHAHAAISCIVAHQKLYHSDLYLLYSSHICIFILMSIVHEVINIATSNLTETCI